MAGEYYKWLARNEKPEQKRELTPAEKRRNWWDYHKWHVVIGAVCVLMLCHMLWGMIQNSRNEPDYCIAYVGQTILPDGTVDALQAAFAELGEDINGNGKVQVEILQYQIKLPDTSESIEDILLEQESDRNSTALMQLMVNVETAESILFLLEDAQQFQADYEVLARVDGTLPENTPDSTVPVSYAWTDCPVLTGLELGTFSMQTLNGPIPGDSQTAMAGLSIARRGIWNTEAEQTDPKIAGALRLWDILTEGAGE